MKTVEQLLELSKNPYYKFTNDEKVILDDFLARKRAKAGQNSQKQNEKISGNDSPVRVRNVVPKTVDRVEDAPEPAQSV